LAERARPSRPARSRRAHADGPGSAISPRAGGRPWYRAGADRPVARHLTNGPADPHDRSPGATDSPVRALAVEMHENWLEGHRFMDDLREHEKEVLRMAA
jgi:hypothetical protein